MDADDAELQSWIDQLIEAKCALEAEVAYNKTKKWLRRRWLVHPFNQARSLQDDFFHTSFQELKEFPDKFEKLMRMKPSTFNVLLNLVCKEISPAHKTSTAILEEQRLFITFMYLAHGTQVAVLAAMNRIAESTVYKIIDETCEGIYVALQPDYVEYPSTSTWRNIGKKFGECWQLPGCLAAIDGKHIKIKAPDNSGSMYWNYKKHFSIVLLAAVNHIYEFLWFSCGSYGGESDAGILSKCSFGDDLEHDRLNTPKELFKLPNSQIKIPYFFIGDEAFSLRKNFMKPYHRLNLTESEKIFNYRISRARRCVESAFGILVMRWRIFERFIGLQPDSVDRIVKSCICLHNFLSSMNDKSPDIIDYLAKQQETSVEMEEQVEETNSDMEAAAVRDLLKEYFVSESGNVPWQLERVRRGFTSTST